MFQCWVSFFTTSNLIQLPRISYLDHLQTTQQSTTSLLQQADPRPGDPWFGYTPPNSFWACLGVSTIYQCPNFVTIAGKWADGPSDSSPGYFRILKLEFRARIQKNLKFMTTSLTAFQGNGLNDLQRQSKRRKFPKSESGSTSCSINTKESSD